MKTHFLLGESKEIFSWFKIAFVENPGMAYGIEFGGFAGKILLTVFRIILIGAIIWYIKKVSTKVHFTAFYIAAGLILSGAIGNVLDSAFYGVIFDKGTTYNTMIQAWSGYSGLAQANFEGYANFLSGCVVDMLYFPLFEFNWPEWMPVVGGEHFQFFRPVFNVADSAITIGGILLFIYRKPIFLALK